MQRRNHFFYAFLLLFTNCQLAEVHLDCPTGDCSTNDLSVVVPTEPTFSGYYRLKTKFRGAAESLDDGQGMIRVPSGGVFMNFNEDSPHQLWRLDTLDNGYFRLKSKASGDDKSLEANGTESPFYNGSSFMDKERNVIGQYWYLEGVEGDYYQLKSPLHQNNCLEGNELNGSNKNGAAFMIECSQTLGQLWKLEEVLK